MIGYHKSVIYTYNGINSDISDNRTGAVGVGYLFAVFYIFLFSAKILTSYFINSMIKTTK